MSNIWKKHIERLNKKHDLKLMSVVLYNNQDKDIEIISSLLSNEFTLSDPSVTLHGKNDVLEYISGIFDSSEVFSFEERNVFVDGKYSIIEFELKINNTVLIGTDVISWGNQDKMLSMKAYLYEVKNES